LSVHFRFLVFLGALLAGCTDELQKSEPPSERAPLSVHVHQLQLQDWQGTVDAFGVLEAAEEVDISVDFSAPVLAVLVKEGQVVRLGDPLVELDREKRLLHLRQSEEATVQARAAMDESRLNLQRVRSLVEKQTLAQEILDNAELQMQGATGAYQESLAARALAEREVRDSHIVSPANGTVDVRAVEPGEMAMPGKMLIRLQASNTMRVEAWVSERDINYVQAGAMADVTVSSMRGKLYPGVVESVGINAHQRTGNYPVKVVVGVTGDKLRPGMTAGVSIKGITVPQQLFLPERALVDRNRRRVVYTLEGGQAVQREPILGAGHVDRLVILEGLQAGDRLILSGLEHIVDGTRVSEAPPGRP
jgi:RND family efflux transporter MFP subunit